MLREMIELSRKVKEEMKAIQSEIKEDMQGTKTEGKETGTQTKDLKQNKEINIQLEQNEETRMQKMKRGWESSGTTLNIAASES